MAQIRCSKCGGLNFRDNGVIVECMDCHNVTYAIPRDAVVKFDNPVAADGVNPVVTLQFDRTKLDNPRRGFCVNDNNGACEVCNVLRHRYEELAGNVSDACAEAAAFLVAHPELAENECFAAAFEARDAIFAALDGGEEDGDESPDGEPPEETAKPAAQRAKKTRPKKG